MKKTADPDPRAPPPSASTKIDRQRINDDCERAVEEIRSGEGVISVRTMNLTRHRPPIVAQTHVDSCWAAVLESWSIVDGRIPRQHQQPLIHRWGEGGTGGITPLTKVPVISASLGLSWGGSDSDGLVTYLESHLPESHVFCAYRRGAFCHAILIYRFSDRNNIPPHGSRRRPRPLERHAVVPSRRPYTLMRRP